MPEGDAEAFTCGARATVSPGADTNCASAHDSTFKYCPKPIVRIDVLRARREVAQHMHGHSEFSFFGGTMSATTKGYSAADDTEISSRSLAQREDAAIAHFLAKTDQLLAIVLAALVLCMGYISLG